MLHREPLKPSYMSPIYDHVLPGPIMKRCRVRNEDRKVRVALPNLEKTFLLDRNEEVTMAEIASS